MKTLIKYIIAASLLFVLSTKADAQVSIGLSIRIAPPLIPEYVQPPCPVDGYMWTPGYWAYGPDGYYWVPGAWVAPPQTGYLWTPGYWGFIGGFYRWHAGYWGPHVGYYGGINYGCGYYGNGFGGGVWRGSVFSYNSAAWNVNRTVVHNTYINRTVIVNRNSNRTSFNGRGGIMRQPTNQERGYMNERHIGATSTQTHYQSAAGRNKNQYYAVNHGAPHTTTVNRSAAAHPATPNNVNRVNNNNNRTNINNANRNNFNRYNNQSPARPNMNHAPSNTYRPANNPATHSVPMQRPNNSTSQMSAGRPQTMSTPHNNAHAQRSGGSSMRGSGGHRR